jgi:hypothetical protein
VLPCRSAVIVRGAGTASTVVYALARNRHFTANSPGNLTITGLALVNGYRTSNALAEGGSVLVNSVGPRWMDRPSLPDLCSCSHAERPSQTWRHWRPRMCKAFTRWAGRGLDGSWE